MKVALTSALARSTRIRAPRRNFGIRRDHAIARRWTVTGEEYVDHSSAADLRGRTSWRALRDAASTWDVLVVTKIDRGWRSVLAMLTDVERLDGCGKSFQAATQPDLHTGGAMCTSCARSCAPWPSSNAS